MRKARRASRGRIPASEESPVPKAASQRGHLIRLNGDLGESAFLHKATGLGFMVARPWRNIYCYDFIVEGGHNFWRVQVKSSAYLLDGLYCVGVNHRTRQGPRAYTAQEIDFVAVYIIPEDTWYILPVHEAARSYLLLFRPKGRPGRDPWAHYREAWHLLREPDGLVFG